MPNDARSALQELPWMGEAFLSIAEVIMALLDELKRR